MDKYTLRQNIADYTCKHFFDGTASLKGKIIKDLAVLDSDTLMDYYVTLKNQEDYILDELRKMDTKNSFKFPYGRFKYLYGMVRRLIKESRKEISATLNDNSDQKKPLPEQKPPTKASAENEPATSDADLFEVDPDTDAIHEAWSKLDEGERRKNWERAIAVHQQQHPPKASVYDEMY